MIIKKVNEWTSSGKTFRIGDHVIFSDLPTLPNKISGTITSIEVCTLGDGHVILDGNPNTLTDFRFVDFDKSYYRNEKLKELGI